MVSKVSFKLYSTILLVGLVLFLCSGCRKEKEEALPVDPTSEKPACRLTSVVDSASKTRQDYIYEQEKLSKIIFYYDNERTSYTKMIYDENNRKIKEEYYQEEDSLPRSYISYKYNSIGSLTSVSEQSYIVFLGEISRSYLYIYDLKNRIVRLKQITGIVKKALTNIQLIYDEYDNIVEMRNCTDETCKPYISYEYDYTLKASPDSEYGFQLEFSPNHFIKRKVEYFDYNKINEVYYTPIETDNESNIVKIASYSSGELVYMRTYTYKCN